MVSEPVLVAVVAGVFTVIGAVIGSATTYFSDRKNAKEAERQLYNQHALEEKFTAYRTYIWHSMTALLGSGKLLVPVQTMSKPTKQNSGSHTATSEPSGTSLQSIWTTKTTSEP